MTHSVSVIMIIMKRAYLPSANEVAERLFLHLSVILSTGVGGGCLPQCMLGYTHPPPPPSRRLLLRTVRIPLECILVNNVVIRLGLKTLRVNNTQHSVTFCVPS